MRLPVGNSAHGLLIRLFLLFTTLAVTKNTTGWAQDTPTPSEEKPIPATVWPIAVVQAEGRIGAIDDGEIIPALAMPRARLGARGKWSTWAKGQINIEFARAQPFMLDASLTLMPDPMWEITTGVSHTPTFVQGKDGAIVTSSFSDHGTMLRALWPNRELGVEVHMLPTEWPIEMWLRVGSGQTFTVAPDPDGFALDGRLDFVWERARAQAVPALAKSAYGARVGMAARIEKNDGKTGSTLRAPWGDVVVAAPTLSGDRTLLVGHAVGFLENVRVSIDGAVSSEHVADAENAPLPNVTHTAGVVGQVDWMLTGQKRTTSWAGQAVSSWEQVMPMEATGRSALELSLRAEEVWFGVGTETNEHHAHVGSTALTWYLNEAISVGLQGHVMQIDTMGPDTAGNPAAVIADSSLRWSTLVRTMLFWR